MPYVDTAMLRCWNVSIPAISHSLNLKRCQVAEKVLRSSSTCNAKSPSDDDSEPATASELKRLAENVMEFLSFVLDDNFTAPHSNFLTL